MLPELFRARPPRRPPADDRGASAHRPADHADGVRRHRVRRGRRARPGATRAASPRRSSPSATGALLDGRALDPTLLAGFCYTQFADTYQEANGLLYADRTPKIPLDADRRGDTAGAGVADANPVTVVAPERRIYSDADGSQEGVPRRSAPLSRCSPGARRRNCNAWPGPATRSRCRRGRCSPIRVRPAARRSSS